MRYVRGTKPSLPFWGPVATAILATDHAKLITGDTVYVDGGYHILG